MRLYLGDEEKLTSFSLPENVEESFLFSYTSNITNIESFINIYAQDEQWYIKNNEDIEVLYNSSDVLFDVFNINEIKVKGVNSPIFLYSYPTYNENYRDIKLDGVTSIFIGKKNNNSIIYQNEYMEDTELSITVLNGVYYVEQAKETKSRIYINNRIVKGKTPITVGDTLFVNNLKE